MLKCEPVLVNLLLLCYTKLSSSKTTSYAEQDVYFSGFLVFCCCCCFVF